MQYLAPANNSLGSNPRSSHCTAQQRGGIGTVRAQYRVITMIQKKGLGFFGQQRFQDHSCSLHVANLMVCQHSGSFAEAKECLKHPLHIHSQGVQRYEGFNMEGLSLLQDTTNRKHNSKSDWDTILLNMPTTIPQTTTLTSTFVVVVVLDTQAIALQSTHIKTTNMCLFKYQNLQQVAACALDTLLSDAASKECI